MISVTLKFSLRIIRITRVGSYSFLVLFLLIVQRCSVREPMEILKEYEMGFTSDNKIRTFYYFRLPENDTLLVRFVPSVENGIHYVTEFSSTRKRDLGYRKFKMEGSKKEMVEVIHYDYSDLWLTDEEKYTTVPVEIIRQQIVTGGKYNGGSYEMRSLLPDNMIIDISTTETFEKDTIYSWNGAAISALKFGSVVNFRTSFRFTPFFKKSDYQGCGHVLFAKEVGLVYYKLKSDIANQEMTLLALEVSEPDQSVH